MLRRCVMMEDIIGTLSTTQQKALCEICPRRVQGWSYSDGPRILNHYQSSARFSHTFKLQSIFYSMFSGNNHCDNAFFCEAGVLVIAAGGRGGRSAWSS